MSIVLLSGGLDSTTVAAHAKAEGHDLVALTFDYGQRHRREIEAAGTVARLLDVPHQVVDLTGLERLSWYSALTAGGLEVPKTRSLDQLAGDIPVTYVPMRNTIFLTLAAALLESRVLSLIEDGRANPKEVSASIFIAANAVDFSGYPDCRPEYFDTMRRALVEGSKLGKQYDIHIGVETPLLYMTKAEIVRLGARLGAPLEHTWSCYEGGETPCGACDSCLLRAKGFAEADIADPLLERLRREGKIA